MIVRKRRHGERLAGWEPCANGCHSVTGSKDLGRSFASHVAVILDVETPLCAKCAEEWRRVWDGALSLEAETVAA